MHPRSLPLGSLALVAILSASSVSADTLVTYLHDTWPTTVESLPADTGSVATNLTAGVLTDFVLTGETARSGFSSGTRSFYANTDQLGTAEPAFNATSDHIAFTLTVADGFAMSLSSLSFNLGASAFGATGVPYTINAALRTSIDPSVDVGSVASTFATLPTYANPASIQYQAQLIDMGDASLQNLTGSVTFYLYFWDSSATGTNETMRMNDIALSGTVSVIPEPSTYAVFLGLAALGATTLRRRRA